MAAPVAPRRSPLATVLATATLLTVLALLAAAPAASAQGFGIVRDEDPFQDGWIAQVFADDDRLATDAYSNTGGGDHDPYPVAGTGTGVYELAGGHPFIGVTDFTFRRDGPNGPPTGGNVAHLRVDIPRGLMPNPGQFTRCTDDQLESFSCPLDSQIGTEKLTLYIQALAPLTGDIELEVPLYNMTPLTNPEDGPQQDTPARFAFHPAEAADAISAFPLGSLPAPIRDLLADALPSLATGVANLHSVHIVGGVRDAPSGFGPHDNGLFFTIDHLPAFDPGNPASPGVIRSNLTFWGVPGDPAHDPGGLGQPGRGTGCVALENLGGTPVCTPGSQTGPAPDPDTPFLTNPTECSGSDLISRLSVWSHADAFDQIDESTPAVRDVDDGVVKHGAQGCADNVPFDGGVAVDPGQGAADAPSGADVALTVPQDGLHDRGLFATSHVRDVSVTLPPGMTINPSAANGLEACTDAQLAANVGVPGGEACPAASRIGTTTAISPLLPPAAGEPDGSTPALHGSAYVGQPLASDQYRLFVTVEGRGISIRLKGSVRPDPSSGQITAVFENNPQLPFSDLRVDFRDGPRAPLATPLDCGPKTASASLVPWSGTPAITPTSAPFAIGGAGCPAGFAPGFGASTADATSGAFAPFTASISRPDRNQFLSRVRIDTPPGLAAMISRVEKCPSAQAAQGACPAESRIGTATTLVGAGPEPYRLSGPVYLTESYDGAPFGMVVVIRALAGPYDLGTVVVRQRIYVDSEDAHVSVISDPLPQILEGVPVRLRDVDVTLDREGFVFNPTSCGGRAVGATLHSIDGTAAGRQSGLSFAGCGALGFEPEMGLRLLGARQTRFGRHPGLLARVRQPFGGQANIARARVKLPSSLALDPDNSQVVCSVEDAQRADCPKRTRIGFARAVSPALDEPLKGPVYLVQGIRTDPDTGEQIRTLPSLLAKLGGQVRINVRGTTAVVGKRSNLVSTFESVPDAPITRFGLRVKGGKRGLLVVTRRKGRGACARAVRFARAGFIGHNTKRSGGRVKLSRPCANPRLRLRRVNARGNRLVVRGTLAKQARRRPRVVVRCGKARIAKRAKRAGRRWRAAVRLRGRCARADRVKLRVAYPGGGNKFRPAARGRRVSV